MDIPAWVSFEASEGARWLNAALKAVWAHLDRATSNAIMKAVGDILDKIIDGNSFINYLKFGPKKRPTFSLGTIPPLITGVHTVEREQDSITMEIDFKWEGNPDVTLEVGGAAINAGLTRLHVRIDNMAIHGKIQVKLGPLMPQFPLFAGIRIMFVTTPYVNYNISFNVIPGFPDMSLVILPGAKKFLQGLLVNEVLNRFMVFPKHIDVVLKDPKKYSAAQPASCYWDHVLEEKRLEDAIKHASKNWKVEIVDDFMKKGFLKPMQSDGDDGVRDISISRYFEIQSVGNLTISDIRVEAEDGCNVPHSVSFALPAEKKKNVGDVGLNLQRAELVGGSLGDYPGRENMRVHEYLKRVDGVHKNLDPLSVYSLELQSLEIHLKEWEFGMQVDLESDTETSLIKIPLKNLLASLQNATDGRYRIIEKFKPYRSKMDASISFFVTFTAEGEGSAGTKRSSGNAGNHSDSSGKSSSVKAGTFFGPGSRSMVNIGDSEQIPLDEYFTPPHLKIGKVRSTEAVCTNVLKRFGNDSELRNILGSVPGIGLPDWYLDPMHEKSHFLQIALRNVWPYVDKAVCDIVRDNVTNIIADLTKKVFAKLKLSALSNFTNASFSSFTLGKTAPVVSSVAVGKNTGDELCLDLRLILAGESKIVLKSNVCGLLRQRIAVHDIQMVTGVRVTFNTLVGKFPLFANVHISLFNIEHISAAMSYRPFPFVPDIELSALPGFQTLIEKFLRDKILRDSVGIVAPRHFTLRLMSPEEVNKLKEESRHSAIGGIKVKVKSAKGLKKMDWYGLSDPFVVLAVDVPGKSVGKYARTEVQRTTLKPVWNEEFEEFLVPKQSAGENRNITLRLFVGDAPIRLQTKFTMMEKTGSLLAFSKDGYSLHKEGGANVNDANAQEESVEYLLNTALSRSGRFMGMANIQLKDIILNPGRMVPLEVPLEPLEGANKRDNKRAPLGTISIEVTFELLQLAKENEQQRLTMMFLARKLGIDRKLRAIQADKKADLAHEYKSVTTKFNEDVDAEDRKGFKLDVERLKYPLDVNVYFPRPPSYFTRFRTGHSWMLNALKSNSNKARSFLEQESWKRFRNLDKGDDDTDTTDCLQDDEIDEQLTTRPTSGALFIDFTSGYDLGRDVGLWAVLTGRRHPEIIFTCQHESKFVRGELVGQYFFPYKSTREVQFRDVSPLYGMLKVSVRQPGLIYGFKKDAMGEINISVRDVVASTQIPFSNWRLSGSPQGSLTFKVTWREWDKTIPGAQLSRSWRRTTWLASSMKRWGRRAKSEIAGRLSRADQSSSGWAMVRTMKDAGLSNSLSRVLLAELALLLVAFPLAFGVVWLDWSDGVVAPRAFAFSAFFPVLVAMAAYLWPHSGHSEPRHRLSPPTGAPP